MSLEPLEAVSLPSGEFLGNVEFDNKLVYKLYGLTEKEIGIVEAGK